MSFESILQFATLWTLILGITSLWVKIHGNRRHINASLFVEYTKRYDDIVSSFPKEALARGFAGGELPEENIEITICVYRFLHFLAGAFYFYRKGYLDKKAWGIWQGEINTILRSPVFRREWHKFADEHSLSPEFCRYVESVQARTTEIPARSETVKRIF
jgi:hypothetical protein